MCKISVIKVIINIDPWRGMKNTTLIAYTTILSSTFRQQVNQYVGGSSLIIGNHFMYGVT